MVWNKGVSKYNREHYDFIIKHKDLTWSKIVELFNNKFNTNVTKDGLNGCLRKFQGNTKLLNIHEYTVEQDKWLFENYPSFMGSANELVEIFNKKFNCKISSEALKTRCQKIGCKKIDLKEHISFNSHKNQSFKIGSEHIDASNGYTYIKVNDIHIKGQRTYKLNWQLKQRYVWEQAYGKIPNGYNVIFLDGNIQNFDLDNLELATKKEILHLKALGWYGNKETVKTGLEVIRTEQVFVDLGLIKRQKYDITRLEKCRRRK